jgi:hypothetical protein
MIDVIAAEWLKIRTVRSTYGVLATLGAFVAGAGLLAWYAAHMWDTLGPDRRDTIAVSSLEGLVETVAQLCLAILGVLAITPEYTSGMIRATFTVAPSRRAVLAAKALVVATVSGGSALVALVATYLLRLTLVGDRPIRGIELVTGSRWVAVLPAMALSVTMFALLGLGLGAITRSAVASITALAILWYVVPLVVYHLPAPWNQRIGSIHPGALAGELAGIGNPNSVFGAELPPLAALAVMVGYAVIPLVIAAALMTRRDA